MGGEKIVFLGDSITLGYGLQDPTKRFSTVFCQMTGNEELNYGITGTLMAKAGHSRDNGTDFVTRYTLMNPDADAVIVFGGTNDYFWTDMPIDGADQQDPAYFRNAVKTLCEGLQARYPGKKIMFITPYRHRGHGNYLGGASCLDANDHPTSALNYCGLTLADYVDCINGVCADYGIPVLDLYETLGIDISTSDADYQNYTIDGCHPNDAGHQLIAEKLYDFYRGL